VDVEPIDDAADGVEVPLSGGDVTDGVVRVGDTVRRPRGPWSSSVASYLHHLDQVGYPESPRYHGIDERGRDVLEFIPGDVPSQPVVESWAAASSVLVGVADLLRRLHDASASFVPPADACWFGDDIHVDMPADVPLDPPPDVISHFDVTPQNVVFRDGKPIGLIDFDLTRPGSRLVDVVNTAMWWVPLFPEQDRDPALALCETSVRLATFVNAYGLDDHGKAAFCDVAINGATRSWHRMQANAERRGGGWARMWAEGVGDRILRRRTWMLQERTTLEAALRADERPSHA
jgi:Phosphotransferase enzyme family